LTTNSESRPTGSPLGSLIRSFNYIGCILISSPEGEFCNLFQSPPCGGLNRHSFVLNRPYGRLAWLFLGHSRNFLDYSFSPAPYRLFFQLARGPLSFHTKPYYSFWLAALPFAIAHWKLENFRREN
jgi:hypothetical protein